MTPIDSWWSEHLVCPRDHQARNTPREQRQDADSQERIEDRQRAHAPPGAAQADRALHLAIVAMQAEQAGHEMTHLRLIVLGETLADEVFQR